MERSSQDCYMNIGYIKSVLIALALIIGTMGCGSDSSSTGPDPDPNPDPVEDGNNLTAKVEEDSTLSVFYEMLVQAGLDGELKTENRTILAPADSIFDKLPEGFMDNLSTEQLKEIISYHLLPDAASSSEISEQVSIETVNGEVIFVQAENNIELNRNVIITEGDIEASNGFIHKIDNILIPDAYLNLYDVIHKRYTLSKFACHCTSGRTNLESTLTMEDVELTVFAPTDEAFDRSETDVDNLSDTELKNIMEYHVVEEKLLSGDLTDGQTVTTMNGDELTISLADDGTISLNGEQAIVQTADIEGTNGVIYIIDSLLEPPAQE